jgi:choline/glycine/proline betaine transport protein
MEEVAQELRLRGAAVELKSLPPEEGRTLATSTCWCTWATSRTLSTRSGRSSTRCRALPIGRAAKSTYYRLETFLLEGSQGNDLMDYSKEQVITDILDQYERHLNFIHLHRKRRGTA